MIEVSGIRAEVLAFAIDMERRLRENEYKAGWHHLDDAWFVIKLLEELGEIANMLVGGNRDEYHLEDLINETADVGNIAMMLHDWAVRTAERQRTMTTLPSEPNNEHFDRQELSQALDEMMRKYKAEQRSLEQILEDRDD